MVSFPKTLAVLLLHFASRGLTSADAEADNGWRFVVIADWHGAKPFVANPINEGKRLGKNDAAGRKMLTFRHIKKNYGGELMVLPGDSNSGKWYKEEFLDILKVKTAEEAVKEAGRRCYQSMKLVLEKGGYSKLLMAVGDHELGGNSWPIVEMKTELLPDFRRIFFSEFNRDMNGTFLYTDPIGKADSRPLNTVFDTTSYAYRHKNVLFVTVDVFQSMSSDFMDRSRGLGGEGSVTCDVIGTHLEWFRKVLSEARKDESIKHIFVQAHPPIIQPVRKIRCTGQFMDGAENSDFFKAMREYNVDVYFSGDVHANTVTKDDESNVVQVVSRGNAAQNFVTVDVSDEIISINQYNEIGPKPRNNENYEFYGKIVIDKSGEETTFESSGSMKLLDRKRPMIHLSFDETFPLSERPVLAMEHDDIWETLNQRKITIQGVECWNSFPNKGEFGQQYDAQVANVALEKGVQGKAASFNSTKSRVAFFAMGPHTGGVKISYSLWFKTKASSTNQVLLHFGEVFSMTEFEKNQIFTLTLDQGVPALHAGANMKLVPTDRSISLADARWKHLAISMPRNSCRLSEVQMFINGELVGTEVQGKDDFLFFTTSGSMSIGGFGHSDLRMSRRLMPSHKPYIGVIDELYVWADSLSSDQIKRLIAGPTFAPTTAPTATLTKSPTLAPTPAPTTAPTMMPTVGPSAASTTLPTAAPTKATTLAPSRSVTLEPTQSIDRTDNQVSKVTEEPTRTPTKAPTPTTSRRPDLFAVFDGHMCNGDSFISLRLKPKECKRQCRQSSECAGYDVKLNRNKAYICRLFDIKPTLGRASKKPFVCGIKN